MAEGIPLSERQVAPKLPENRPIGGKGNTNPEGAKATAAKQAVAGPELHSPGNISFVRSRMLYARGALNARGEVRFGLRHIRKCLWP